ncbi:MAG TPA: DUF1203 domain-containing protein [Steroidobacteraceae bacterium]|nr:DUF1203 domain-containing protein [Steroidobacteraceae bacterium]
MAFRITGLPAANFEPLFGLSDAELARRGVTRVVADQAPGFPDRVELRDAAPGETLLLLNYEHQPARNAYRASHAIFVREGARATYNQIDEVPAVLRARMISLRAFDAHDLMVDADLADGRELEPAIERLLQRNDVAYLHAHYAKRGCYAARIERA